MDDLARRKVIHSKVCLVRVINKVLRNLENPTQLEDYLRCIGRLHQLAGVDQTYLALSGKSFCDALDTIQQHKELWSKQVSSLSSHFSQYYSNVTRSRPLGTSSSKLL